MPRHSFRSMAVAALLLGMLLVGPALAEPDAGSVEAVRSSWQVLNQWLASSPHGENWRRYLMADRLEAQLASSTPDTNELMPVFERFESGASGLEMARFAAVRVALRNWIQQQVPASALPELIRQAKDNFSAPPEGSFEQLRQDVLADAAALDAYFARGGEAYQSAWHTYLNWETLQEQLAAETPDLAKLNTVLQQLYGYQVGLELPIFTDLRSSLHAYMNAAVVDRTPNIADQYNDQLEQLATNIESYQANGESAQLQAIGRGLGWLQSAGQAEHIQRLVRIHFAKPNLYARVSANFITRGVNEPVDETMAINDCILGTSLYGTARTLANVQLALLPNPHQAELALQFHGTAYSNNVGTQRGVTIYSTGQTQLNAEKRLYFNENGLTFLPSTASAATSSQINDIQHHLRIVRRLAWKQAGRQKPQAERVASQNAAARLQTQFDTRTAELLDEPQRRYYESFRLPLLRRGQFPELLHVSTAANGVLLRVLQASDFQVGAASAPPALTGAPDVAIQLHETFVGNMSEALLAGFTLTDERLVNALEEAEREIPEELKIEPNKDPWSITFADTQPIQVQFANDRVRVVIRGKRFTRGDQRVTDEMEISAVYNLTRTPTGAKLTREGEVHAEYTRQGFENAVKIAIKTLMRNKFTALFKEELVGEGVQLQGRLGAGGFLRLNQLSSDKGWLVAGWMNTTDAPPAAPPTETTAQAN